MFYVYILHVEISSLTLQSPITSNKNVENSGSLTLESRNKASSPYTEYALVIEEDIKM